MNRLNILTFPDPRLRKKAVPITTFDKDLEKKRRYAFYHV